MKIFSANTPLEIAAWEAMKEPDVESPYSFYTAKQKLRILIEDPCGNPLAFEPTPTFNISILKKRMEPTPTLFATPHCEQRD